MSESRLDPFSMIYESLWKMVERNQELQKYIPVGNRIKFNVDSLGKEEIMDSDVPELTLLSGGGVFGTNDNSTGRSITKYFVWALTTGNLQINPIFNKISWELFRSMSDWECVLCNLTWCNCRFVNALRLVSAEDGTLIQDLNRNVPGWSSLWQVEIDCVFPVSSLRLN